MSEEEAKMEWETAEGEEDGQEAEGELQLQIPAIPEQGIAATRLKARGTRASAARQLAGQASRLLRSSAVQAVLPPQARIALKAAQKLGRMMPRKLKRWLPW